MLGLAFIAGSYFLAREFKRVGIPDNYASEITLIAIVLGVVGSKLFDLFENWGKFLDNPVGMMFSPGGLTYYGGFLLAMGGVTLYLRKKKLGFFQVGDLISPSLAIAYGIGRIGCHLAGDGDYGVPTSLPWGVSYAKGIVKPTEMFFGSKYALQFPNGILPNDTPLHPTPIYEFLAGVAIFSILWSMRKNIKITGRIFMLYLVLSGISRFLVEFVRLNPSFFLGLTEAQTISLVLIAVGIIGWFKLPDIQTLLVKQAGVTKKGHKKA